jgi:hypothetical protein
MGWLGWSEQQALSADVNSIMVAMEGKLEMLYPEIKERKTVTATAKFKSFVKSNNAKF